MQPPTELDFGPEDKVYLGVGHFLRVFVSEQCGLESQWSALDVWMALRDTVDTSKMRREEKQSARSSIQL